MDGQLNINLPNNFQSAHEGLCLELLHQGYEAMLITKTYDIDSEEDTLTAHYIDLMTNLPICNDWEIDIIPQLYLYSDKHTTGEEEAKYAPRIDFRFMKWFDKNKIVYYAEAKNLSEKSWNKKNGAFVNASYYYKRYIKTGVSHLLTDYYPNNCILIAYVLNGDKNAVLSNLNNLITSSFANYGIITKPEISVNKEYYISENVIKENIVVLKHMFLQLYTQEHRRNDEIDSIIKYQKKKANKVNNEQKNRIEQQISLLEYVKNEKFQGKAGVLRVNLAWNTIDDLDLHIEIEGGEIYYEKKEIGSGKLDVDANANEPFNKNPQENVVFIEQPVGKCRMKVNFYKSRENVEVDFVLSILTPNDEIKVYLKTINIENQKMVEVAEFEFKEGVLLINDL